MQTIEFTVGFDQLSFLDEKMERVVEPGKFELMLGGSSADLQVVELEVE
jgi:beta-glucosidase